MSNWMLVRMPGKTPHQGSNVDDRGKVQIHIGCVLMVLFSQLGVLNIALTVNSLQLIVEPKATSSSPLSLSLWTRQPTRPARHHLCLSIMGLLSIWPLNAWFHSFKVEDCRGCMRSVHIHHGAPHMMSACYHSQACCSCVLGPLRCHGTHWRCNEKPMRLLVPR